MGRKVPIMKTRTSPTIPTTWMDKVASGCVRSYTGTLYRSALKLPVQ